MLCCICLLEAHDAISVFDEENKNLNIAEIIFKHFSFKENNILHSHICKLCWSKIYDFHEFYENVEKSHKKFQSVQDLDIIKKEEININTNDIKQEEIDEEQYVISEREQQLEMNFDFGTNATKNPLAEFEEHSCDDKSYDDNNSSTSLERVTNKRYKKEKTTEIKLKIKNSKTKRYRKKNSVVKPENNVENKRKKTVFNRLDPLHTEEMIKKHIPMGCNLCVFVGKTFADIVAHFKVEHPNMRAYITCCDKTFTKRFYVAQHAMTHENPDCFSCKLCSKSFTTTGGLQKHNLKYHAPNEELIFACDLCPQKFARLHLLQLHKPSHIPRDEWNFFCTKCSIPKPFASAYLLNIHDNKLHKREKNICNVCAKEIKDKKSFEKHVKEHYEGSGPRLKCSFPNCDSWLKDEDSLKLHLRRHNTDGETYKCPLCEKICPNLRALSRHKVYVHSKKVFKCEHCNKTFKSAITLKEHMTYHTGEVLYNCPFCSRTFNSNANMHSHKKKQHPLEWQALRRQKMGSNPSETAGDIVIQRLNWQKIVTFPSPGEGIKVKGLSWQYDETVIAVGYSNGQVSLLDVEREESISNLFYDSDIIKVYFSKPIKTPDYRQLYRNKRELTHDFFLPPLPHLNSLGISSKAQDYKSFAKGSPCFLVVILKSKVYLLLFGALKSGNIDISQHVSHPDELDIYDVRLCGDFNAMYALLRDGNQLKVLHFNNSVLKQYISPMIHLAQHCADVLESKNYINNTIQCMLEAWETILLEMDNKLTSYANKQTEGSLSADFMELLVFGYATLEIEEFLMQDLTEKGVKKLQNSVDLSYSTIQNLVAKPLQMASINMFYFLNTIKGLARISHYYEHLIVEEFTEAALRECGAFLMKILELQQVIDQSVNDMKLFFSWLCVVIVRLHQQDVTEDMSQLSMEDTIYLADYLNSFEDSVIENDDGTVIKRKFNLEKVGQYLENKPLQQMVKTDVHHLWRRLLEDNDCLQNSLLLYPHEKRLSLIQQRNKMFASIENVFNKPNESISQGFELDASFICFFFNENSECNYDFIRTSYFVSEAKNRDLVLVTIGWQDCIILEFDNKFTELKCFRLQTTPGPFTRDLSHGMENLKIIDLQFYNGDILSLLLRIENEAVKPHSYFIQFPLNQINGKCSLHALPQNLNLCDSAIGHSIFDIIDIANFKSIENSCTNLAVSGYRKVASILAEKRKKMLIFEMEIEDEEDEIEISQNSMLDLSKESSVS